MEKEKKEAEEKAAKIFSGRINQENSGETS